MPAGIGLSQPGESLQRKARVWRIFTDQHGRTFGAQADVSTNQPIGELMPQGFSPPWLPPMRFAKWRREGELEFRWDYETMAAELSGGIAEYYAEVSNFMTDHMPHEAIPEIGEPVPGRVRRSPIGSPPMSPALPLACEQGIPWILGVPGAAVNTMLKLLIEQGTQSGGKEALDFIRARMASHADSLGVERVPSAPVVPIATERARTIADPGPMVDPATVTYKDFIGEAMKRGMSMANAANAWAEHKANLAAEVAA